MCAAIRSVRLGKSDSEVLLNLFAYELSKTKFDVLQSSHVFAALREVYKRCEGGFAVTMIVGGVGLIAFRDANGIRPLVLGKKGDGSFMVASESSALSALGYDFEHDVDPGSAIIISEEGVVEKGRMMGRKIGFPTCNINIKNYVIPKVGVYAVDVYIEKNRKKIKGIANIGYRPTFNQKKLLLEVNLFKFSGNLYNKNLTINFTKFIRGETKFKNIDALKKQINKDIKVAKR